MKKQRDLFIDKSIEAEKLLLEIANDIYINIDLKPMSKAIFFLSRAFLIINLYNVKNYKNLKEFYKVYRQNFKNQKNIIEDDYNFGKIIDQNKQKLDNTIKKLLEIKKLQLSNDMNGLIFNSLLRGKYEAGEGLGTFLTPEEIVSPMVEMIIDLYFYSNKKLNGFVGDISGGTGRFVYSLKNSLNKIDKNFYKKINTHCFLYDQSSLSVSLAKINFYLENYNPQFYKVNDSITSKEIMKLSDKFSLLATNPPFGKNKYQYNYDLDKFINVNILSDLKISKKESKIDPAELFIIKNFYLLHDGGVLGIVLPDGICQTNRIDKIITSYEKNEGKNINLVAKISLPSQSFSLTGTVAKSSFLILQKSSKKNNNFFAKKANNIGFLKKGNVKIVDKKGNDLDKISRDFVDYLKNEYTKLNQPKKQLSKNSKKLSYYAYFPDKFDDYSSAKKENLHISILDIDKTGFIDFSQSVDNDPVTKPKKCNSNDILISCINPRKWRVALVPELNYSFNCSSEFAIIRPNNKISPFLLAFYLQSKIFRSQAETLGVGTSSSRQRINKKKLMDLFVQKININENDAKKFFLTRLDIYKKRINEINIFKKINQ